jgi:hypothetical protein
MFILINLILIKKTRDRPMLLLFRKQIEYKLINLSLIMKIEIYH